MDFILTSKFRFYLVLYRKRMPSYCLKTGCLLCMLPAPSLSYGSATNKHLQSDRQALKNQYLRKQCVTSMWYCCYMSHVTLLQLNWNPVPTNLEQGYILAVTMQELKKLTTRAYRVGNER